MSSLYNLEPQPTAKVVLQTTSGDLTLELFAKQTPLASRNFLQHCLDGYYNNTIFHRLVPGFIIQGGDPTGSGSGGISAINDGEPFHDEFHTRLKFNRRGLLGMANEGSDSNASQFFFTLGSTPELQGRNTMFGRVEGDTIYNLMKMADAELSGEDGSERPLYPTRIIGAEVLVNPFENMVARVRDAPRSKEDASKREAKKRKKPATKNTLSFADEEGDGEIAAPVMKKAKANPKLVVVQEDERETKHTEEKDREQVKVKAPRVEVERTVSNSSTAIIKPPTPKDVAEESDEDQSPEPDEATQRRKALEKTNAEIQALKASMKRNVNVAPTETKPKPKSILEAMTPSTSTRGRKRGKLTDEQGALDMFKAFKQRLEGLPLDNDEKDEDGDASARSNGHGSVAAGAKGSGEISLGSADDEEAELCDLHFIANCQSCRSWDEDQLDGNVNGDVDDDVGWMAHSLKFAKDTLGKDLEWKKKMEEIEVIDPREKARVIQEERRKDRDRGRGKR